MNAHSGGAQRLLAAGEGVAQLARHALGAERLGPGHAVGVEHERGAPARDQLGDAVQRVGVLERAPQLGVDDRVDVARLAAAGVADGLLALGVGPAGAVGDQLRVVLAQQPADDLAQRAELVVGGVGQRGADVVAEGEVAGGRLGVAGAFGGAPLAVLLGGVAQLVVVEARAAEVGLLAGGLAVGVGELLADGVEHEHRVDDPDAGGEVLAALEHPAVAAVGGAVAQRPVDAQLERAAAGAGGERVELGVELLGLAAERGGGLGVALGAEVVARVLDLLGAVEQDAVVDPDGVDALVLDDGAVDEAAEVAQRLVVQLAGGHARGDGLGELGGDVVHVGQAVRHAHRQLVAGGPLGDPLADRVGEGELAAQAVALAGADAEVGADDGHPVGVGQPGARLPAVAELLLLVAQGERLARVLLRLDAADLVLAGLVVEQQDDQARDGGEALEVRGAGEFVAGAGGQQAALAGVERSRGHRPRGVRCRASAARSTPACGRGGECLPDRLPCGDSARARADPVGRAR